LKCWFCESEQDKHKAGCVFPNTIDIEEYRGGFFLEITEDADVSVIPMDKVEMSGTKICVPLGRANVVMGGLQFHANEIPFGFGWDYVKIVADEKGNVLWKNKDYDSM